MSKAPSILTGAHNFLVRPYAGMEKIQHALDLTELVINGNRYASGAVALPNDQFPVGSATVEAYLDLKELWLELDETGIPRDHVKFACVIYGSVIAEAQIIEDVTIADAESPLVVAVGGSPLITSSPSGFDLRVFLYLAKDLDARGWHPSVPGTWLAFKEFRIAPQTALSRFSPTPLDDDIRQHYGLPAESLSFVRVGDGILDVESLDEDLDVFVDVTILRLLQENPNSALSKYVQLELAIATLWSLVAKVAYLCNHRNPISSGSDGIAEGTAAWNLCSEVARSAGITVETLLSAAGDDPGIVRTAIEVYVNSRKTTSLALREVS